MSGEFGKGIDKEESVAYNNDMNRKGRTNMGFYKMIASDLDGTLLNGKQEVTEENWEAIRRMTESGVWFVPASGRSLGDFPREVLTSPYVRYVVHSNGAAIYDKELGRSLRFSMPREESMALLDVLSDYEIDPILLYDGECYVARETDTPEYHNYHRMGIVWQEHCEAHYVKIDRFEAFCRSLESIDMICVFFHSNEQLAACNERLRAMGYQVVSSDPCNLEIMHKSAGKGNALLHLSSMLGLDASEMIAVGDSLNDVDMICKAGLGLAVKNAGALVKESADRIICSNEEHVMAAIEALLDA